MLFNSFQKTTKPGSPPEESEIVTEPKVEVAELPAEVTPKTVVTAVTNATNLPVVGTSEMQKSTNHGHAHHTAQIRILNDAVHQQRNQINRILSGRGKERLEIDKLTKTQVHHYNTLSQLAGEVRRTRPQHNCQLGGVGYECIQLIAELPRIVERQRNQITENCLVAETQSSQTTRLARLADTQASQTSQINRLGKTVASQAAQISQLLDIQARQTCQIERLMDERVSHKRKYPGAEPGSGTIAEHSDLRPTTPDFKKDFNKATDPEKFLSLVELNMNFHHQPLSAYWGHFKMALGPYNEWARLYANDEDPKLVVWPEARAAFLAHTYSPQRLRIAWCGLVRIRQRKNSIHWYSNRFMEEVMDLALSMGASIQEYHCNVQHSLFQQVSVGQAGLRNGLYGCLLQKETQMEKYMCTNWNYLRFSLFIVTCVF